MDYTAEGFCTLAQLLELPDNAFGAHLAYATDPALVTSAAAGQVALFAERVADLSLEERQELFAETFRSHSADADRRCIVSALRGGVEPGPSAALARAVEQLRHALLCQRNPYHHVLTAISALIAPAGTAGG